MFLAFALAHAAGPPPAGVATEDAPTADEAPTSASRARRQRIASLERRAERATGEQQVDLHRALAQLYIEEGRDARDDSAEASPWFDKGVTLYRQLLADAPADVHPDELTFALAQALRDAGHADEANVELTRLVKTWPESRLLPDAYATYMQVVAMDPQGAHSQFCAESAIYAADEMIRAEHRSFALERKLDPLPLSPWETRQLAALDQHLALYPTDEKASRYLYKSAYTLYNLNHFAEAAERFARVIAMDPGSREAEQAVRLILDGLVLAEDWVGLKTAAETYHDQPGLGSETFKGEVLGIYEAARKKLGEVP